MGKKLQRGIVALLLQEQEMMLVQGESVEANDGGYSHGHYAGWRKGLLEAAQILQAIEEDTR